MVWVSVWVSRCVVLIFSRCIDERFCGFSRADAAGKTTILYKMKLNETVTTIPTIGFNVETLEYKTLKMNVWDIGGQDKVSIGWLHVWLVVFGRVVWFIWYSHAQQRIHFSLSHRAQIRALWKYYYQNTDAIIYVIDSADRERVRESADELKKLLRESELENSSLLVFANKQDLPGAMTGAALCVLHCLC